MQVEIFGPRLKFCAAMYGVQETVTVRYSPPLLRKMLFPHLNLWMNLKIKASKQYFSVVLFTLLYKVVLTFEFVEVLKCDH